MITRSYSEADLADAFTLYPKANEGVDREEWISNPKNILLKEGGSYSAFAYEYPGLYTGHYFFRVRGREAISLAKKMLAEMFDNYDAKAIRGLTKTDNRAALWITRQLGFKSCGLIETENGEHELFVLTKEGNK